jgi:hypothetical protein
MVMTYLGITSECGEQASDNVQGHHERCSHRIQLQQKFELRTFRRRLMPKK